MEHEELKGGCLCGAVRYRTSAPTMPPTLCHCKSCRRAAGTHALGLYTVDSSSAVFTNGRLATFASSAKVFRGFCEKCGTSLSYWHADWPDEMSFTIASLDNPTLAPPVDHTWMQDAVPWDKPADGLPQFPQDRPP